MFILAWHPIFERSFRHKDVYLSTFLEKIKNMLKSQLSRKILFIHRSFSDPIKIRKAHFLWSGNPGTGEGKPGKPGCRALCESSRCRKQRFVPVCLCVPFIICDPILLLINSGIYYFTVYTKIQLPHSHCVSQATNTLLT